MNNPNPTPLTNLLRDLSPAIRPGGWWMTPHARMVRLIQALLWRLFSNLDRLFITWRDAAQAPVQAATRTILAPIPATPRQPATARQGRRSRVRPARHSAGRADVIGPVRVGQTAPALPACPAPAAAPRSPVPRGALLGFWEKPGWAGSVSHALFITLS